MKIGVIVAGSQAAKNELIFKAVEKYAPKDAEVINFGCKKEESENYSYVDISLLVGLLIGSGALDFIVTGCSSGQGMMLSCNSMPGVICAYAPTPKDAFLFAQINNGNCLSLPLGEDYTYRGSENLEKTIETLFCEPFGQGYPKSEAERKLKDTASLKKIRKLSQLPIIDFYQKLDPSDREKIRKKSDVITFVKRYGNKEISAWIEEM